MPGMLVYPWFSDLLSTAPMWIVAIAWMYVAMMMAVAEATSPQGSMLGAIITFVPAIAMTEAAEAAIPSIFTVTLPR